MLGLQRRDLDQVLEHGDRALGIARQTRSGVVSRKLQGLQPHLTPHLKDSRIRQFSTEVSALSGTIS